MDESEKAIRARIAEFEALAARAAERGDSESLWILRLLTLELGVERHKLQPSAASLEQAQVVRPHI